MVPLPLSCSAGEGLGRGRFRERLSGGVTAVLPALVVTDFAGTTMKEEGAVLVAYRLALTEFDIPFTEDDLAARRGASKRAVFQELAARVHAPATVDTVATKALAIFEDSLRHEYESGPVQEIEGAGTAMATLR